MTSANTTDHSEQAMKMDAFWIPYTSARSFKEQPLLVSKSKDCFLYTEDGREIYDGLSGLWCSGFGHGRQEIADAMAKAAKEHSFIPAYQVSHPLAFELSERLADLAPDGLDHVFYTNSGSEGVETALKIARCYWERAGQPSKKLLIGRDRAFHGANYGGMSVGGIVSNKEIFGPGIVTHQIRDTSHPENSFTKGIPKIGGPELAEDLMHQINNLGAENVAAVIVEPFSGSAGVLVPPVGYLNRLKEICQEHNILLIFDEVITGFGRLGANFGAEFFGVTPDLMVVAKGITNGTFPMGAVLSSHAVYSTIMEIDQAMHLIEFPHGYTYSAHPIACAVAMASLDILEKDNMTGRVRELTPHFENKLHELAKYKFFSDIRNIGLAGALEIDMTRFDGVKLAYDVFKDCWNEGLFLRCGKNTLQLGPQFNVSVTQLDDMFAIIDKVLNRYETQL